MIDAIVPIYCDGKFRGTGFIYRSYLITSEHVVKDYENSTDNLNNNRITDAQVIKVFKSIEYKYKNSFRVLTAKDCVWSKKTSDRTFFDFIDEDLAIFIIPEFKNDISLFEKNVINGTRAKLYGYHHFNDSNIILQSREILLSDTFEQYNIKQEKCFYGTNQNIDELIISGYSGGPVIYEDKIVGMLVGGVNEDRGIYHFMKSSYILQKIINYEKNSNNLTLFQNDSNTTSY